MSETVNKNINSDNNFKDRDIKQELVQENKYDKFKKNFKKNYRSPNYYGKNRYSCNNGKNKLILIINFYEIN